jgi:hypothetical protein
MQARKHILATILLLFFALPLFAQNHLVHGKVINKKLEPLAFASIQIKDAAFGNLTREDGTYEIYLASGTYELVITMIGFKSQVIPLVVKDTTEQNIILEEEDRPDLTEIIIRTKAKDRAEEVMHNLVRRKDSIQSAAGAYSAKLYIRATQQDSGFAKRKGETEEDDRSFSESDIMGMAMAEISLHLDKAAETQIREQRLGVRKTGNTQYLFHLSATEGNFDFYNNLVKVPVISSTPFVSPVSYSGLVAYRFKTIKVQRTGKHRIYTISVRPRQLTNATMEGEITVSDSTWSILHLRFRFPSYHMHEYDFFEVEQDHEFVNGTAWMVTRQQFSYYSKTKKGRLSGQTTVRYSNFELNKEFPKRHFGVEVSSTSQAAYEKDSAFWNTVRNEPLTDKELRFIRYQDSIYTVTHTEHYLDSIERVTNIVTWKKIALFGQRFYNREKDRTWELPPVRSLIEPFAFGGVRITPVFAYHRIFPNKKDLHVHANLSYGIRNNDLNGTIEISRMYDPFKRATFRLSAGRDFQYIFQGDAYINLIKRNNIYLDNAVGIGHSVELANGLVLVTDLDISLRRSVINYKTGKLVDSLLELSDNQAVPFQPYNAVYGKVRLQYTPAQRYVREPKQKIILGSKWPTFYVEIRKGLKNFMSSEVDFDFVEGGIEQRINMGLLGLTQYSIKTGSFLNQRDLRMIDHQFIRRGDPLFFSNPNRSFQAMDSTFSVFKQYFEGHVIHEFNGLFLNKIPLLKKLKLREVAGAGFLFAQERSLKYVEMFAGIERAFESPFDPMDKVKIGIYVVGSYANQFHNAFQFKIGFTTWDKKRNKWF